MDFGSFYIQWFSRAKHFAQEYVVSEEDAENIVQDIFIALYERRDLLNENLNVVAYLFTSIKNACLDFLKRKFRRKRFISKCRTR
jgi:RNA polymerase sigma factor (sigma-70 family)